MAIKKDKRDEFQYRLEGLYGDLDHLRTIQMISFDDMSEEDRESEKGQATEGIIDQLGLACEAVDSAMSHYEEVNGS